MIKTLLRVLWAAAVWSPGLLAQGATSSMIGSLARSSTAAAYAAAVSGSPDPSTEVMIKHRARVLRDRLTASGVRYWSLSDADLAGKRPDEILQRLSPSAINVGDRIREMD